MSSQSRNSSLDSKLLHSEEKKDFAEKHPHLNQVKEAAKSVAHAITGNKGNEAGDGMAAEAKHQDGQTNPE
ncbi:hypothetical protein DSO57_1019578 [Entomophthora muscae]|uniref:Uncharacterized protein n=1 Tax=Entomophthora muscae TaxID=34485 RepID=A0ACC2TR27_9FUNG|nr:hypothetical protein DSO57_1019578 [Entomophthora muscae]